jgi:hypothetical protein
MFVVGHTLVWHNQTANCGLDHPDLEYIEAAIDSFASLGEKVMITELDVDVLPLTRHGQVIGLPAALRARQAPRARVQRRVDGARLRRSGLLPPERSFRLTFVRRPNNLPYGLPRRRPQARSARRLAVPIGRRVSGAGRHERFTRSGLLHGPTMVGSTGPAGGRRGIEPPSFSGQCQSHIG